MATYKEIFGKSVKYLAADLPAAAGEGQIWYNSTSGTLKGSVLTSAWASGGNMNTGRSTAGDCGTQTAGLVFGGNDGNAPYAMDNTEEYDGTSWTETGTVPHDTSDCSGAGTQTAGLAFGFSSSPTEITATYDGSTWSTVPATIASVGQGRGIGTQGAALMVGFATPGTTSLEYDGSSWTSGGTLNNKRSGQKPGGWGTQTAGLIASGRQSPPATFISNTETYDGSTWTETGANVITPVKRTSGSTASPSSLGIMAGGGDVIDTNDTTTGTQGWDGTAWFSQPSLATARINAMGFGTASAGVVCGGDPGGLSGATEEFTSAAAVKTVTTS